MAPANEFVEYVLDQLAGFGPVTPRRMFGGYGLFSRGVMIALIARDTLFLKVDDGNRPDFEAAGMAPFGYDTKAGRRGIMSYYEAPPDVVEDPDELAGWAAKAADAAMAADKAKRKRRKPKADPNVH